MDHWMQVQKPIVDWFAQELLEGVAFDEEQLPKHYRSPHEPFAAAAQKAAAVPSGAAVPSAEQAVAQFAEAAPLAAEAVQIAGEAGSTHMDLQE
jgi:hypothetical protein